MNAAARTIRTSILIGGSILVIAVLVYVLAPAPFLIKIVSDIFPLVLSISAASLSFLLYRQQSAGPQKIRLWGSMTIGLALWAMGEAIWAIFEILLRQEVPYPSYGDVAWTAGYIFIILAFFSQYLSLRVSLTNRRKLLIVGSLTVVGALVFWLVLLPILTTPTNGKVLEAAFNLIYPLEDMFLLGAGIALVMAFLGGELLFSWGALVLAILFLSSSDLLFAYGSWNGLYYPDGRLNAFSAIFDLIYIAGYVVWNIGLYLQLKLPSAARETGVNELIQTTETTNATGRTFMMLTDAQGLVLFIDPALVELLGLAGAGEALGRSFGELVGLDRSQEELARQQASATGTSPEYTVTLGPAAKIYRLMAITSEKYDKFPGYDVVLQPIEMQVMPEHDREAFFLGQILHQPETQTVDLRMVYFNSVLRYLDLLAGRVGGVQIGSAFESSVNRKAAELACGLSVQKAQITWGPDAQPKIQDYFLLLEEALHYCARLLDFSTIQRKLDELEKQMDPAITQAAAGDNLRIHHQKP